MPRYILHELTNTSLASLRVTQFFCTLWQVVQAHNSTCNEPVHVSSTYSHSSITHKLLRLEIRSLCYPPSSVFLRAHEKYLEETLNCEANFIPTSVQKQKVCSLKGNHLSSGLNFYPIFSPTLLSSLILKLN